MEHRSCARPMSTSWWATRSEPGDCHYISRPVGNGSELLHRSPFRFLLLLNEETRSMAVEREEWIRHDLRRYRIHWTAVANEKRKVIQILYIRLWYSTIQYEVNCSHKVKWSVIPDAVMEQNDKSKKSLTSGYCFIPEKSKKKSFCIEIFTYEHCWIHVSTWRTSWKCEAQKNRINNI